MEVLWDVAITKNGERIWIDDDCKETVFCPECKSEMIPVRGEIVQHHYRHKADSTCSGESAKHWSKKYEIADALSHFGKVEVEGRIGDYIADVLFEDKWAFEVVYSNPPSDEKMNDWRDDLIIFNFNDETVWGGRVYEEICPTTQFFHIKPKPRSCAHVVQSFARDILAGKEVDVCAICREVKGINSRLKSEGICVSCDMERYVRRAERERSISLGAERYREAKMR